MSVLENFKNIPGRPMGGRQGSNVFFFLQICKEVPGEKKGGPVARCGGDRLPLPYFNPWPPFAVIPFVI